MDRSRVARGRWGEDRAAAHYRRLGYEVVDRNWRCRYGEMDLVLRRDRVIVFCEVKTRASASRGTGFEAVDRRKQVRLRRVAAAWLQTHRVHGGLQGVDVRFDVAAVTGVQIEVREAVL